MRQRFVVERSVGEQHHLVGPLVKPLVEADRLAVLLRRLAARDKVVQRRVGDRGRGAEPTDLVVDRDALGDADRRSGRVVAHPVRVLVDRLRDLDVHRHVGAQGGTAGVTSHDQQLHVVLLHIHRHRRR